MRRIQSLLMLFCLLPGSMTLAESQAERVVSLDFCADQFVLKMLPRERILALSPDAEKHFSYMRNHAQGIPQVRPIAEDILVIKPDLVVRSYGGGPHATMFFRRAGLDVLQLPFAGSLEDIRSTIIYVAEQFGVPARGEEIATEMDNRLNALSGQNADLEALYMTPTGVTSGPGTLIDEMLAAAGIGNFQKKPGWHSLPLERLAYEQPDLVAAAFFDSNTNHPALWSAMRHPIAQQQMKDQPMVMLQGAWTACGGWFLLDAIEALADVQR